MSHNMDANTSSSRCPRLGAAAAALLLAGCTALAPRYEAPAMPVPPPQYAEAAQAGSTQAHFPPGATISPTPRCRP
ncbi:hypothetical protein LZ683_14650 [Comamonas testosteroni]|nr:hypothetical protein [Comamonas testosteroni]WEE75425.1 hypothetical protein LZ683_14650 [Comamonas testosteroni]